MVCTVWLVVVCVCGVWSFTPDPTLECAWREAAYRYAHTLQPWRDPMSIFDGLELHTRCNQSTVQWTRQPRPHRRVVSPSVTYYVSTHGSDSNPGTVSKPFLTLHHAVDVSRGSSPTPRTIYLRGGTYYLATTLHLTPQDNFLTIAGYHGEDAVLSGGVPLKLGTWTKWKSGVGGSSYYTTVESPQNITSITGLQINGTRAIRARYPNANPETSLFPNGHITTKTVWLPPLTGMNTTVEHVPIPTNYRGMFQDYRLGIGGPCDRYTPPESYWCQPGGRVAGHTYFVRSPSGLNFTATELPHAPYTTLEGAVVHAWRGNGRWFTWMWDVDGYNPTTSTIHFGRGGFQGGEGSDHGDGWFIENVLEELDWPTEYFYDATHSKLYYFTNGTVSPPSGVDYIATKLSTLIDIRGGQAYPVLNITLEHLTIRATRSTFMDPHGVPSGGDWALERIGAVMLEGTEGVHIGDCLFTRVDGNAIMLSGYNREATIDRNEFVWIGNNAVAAWGYTSMYDGTSGDQPRHIHMRYNLIHEIGQYEKQASGWFQGKSCQNEVMGNIMFNMPRAAVNINDGFGGGTIVTRNLLWNTCRESSDHGPFNSWDRQPFLTMVKDGHTPSWIPADNIISYNFMVANYGANGGCVDNDDGSSFYEIHHNLFMYGGHKSDFDGHSKRSYNNINIYPKVYSLACMMVFNLPHPGYEEGYWNNTCVMPDAEWVYFKITGCDPKATPNDFGVVMGGNKLYSPGGQVKVSCGSVVGFDAWTKLGFDQGTTTHDIPTSKVMMEWAATLLGF